MEEIFKQYGAPIIIVSVIVALIVIFGILLSTNNGLILQQFNHLIEQFFAKANFTGIGGTILPGLLG
jgi:hypothetical protein